MEISMDRKLHLLDSFSALGSDGETYKVLAYEHLVRDESIVDGQEHWEPTGVTEYRLADGARVDMARDGAMRIVDRGIALTTTHPGVMPRPRTPRADTSR
jgi:hypothetical protein